MAEASSNAAVLEELIVKMLGDNSDYKAMLKDSEASSVSTASKIVEAGKLIETVGLKFAALMRSFGADRDTTIAKVAKESEFQLKEQTDILDRMFREGSIKNMEEYKTAYKDLELKYGIAVETAKKQSDGLTTTISYLTAAAGKMAASLADLVPWLSLVATTVTALNTELFKTAWASFTAAIKGAITYLTTFTGVAGSSGASLKSMLAVAGLTAAAVVGISIAVLEAARSLSGFNRELARTAELSKVFDDVARSRAKRIIEDANKEPTAVKEREQLRMGRVGLNEQLESRAKDLRKLEHELSNLDETYSGDYLQTRENRNRGDTLRAQIAAAKSEMDSLRNAVTQVGERIEQVGNPFEDLEEEIKKIDKEIKNLGKDAHEIKLDELSEEDVGLSESNLERLRESIEERKKALKDHHMEEDVKSLTKSLEEQAEVWGMTAREAHIYRLEQEGAHASDVARLKDLDAYLEGAQRFADLQHEGASLTARYATEEEKRAQTIERLNELLFLQIITQETYNRALDDTVKKHRDVEVAARNAAVSGSNEARIRIQAFRDTIPTFERAQEQIRSMSRMVAVAQSARNKHGFSNDRGLSEDNKYLNQFGQVPEYIEGFSEREPITEHRSAHDSVKLLGNEDRIFANNQEITKLLERIADGIERGDKVVITPVNLE